MDSCPILIVNDSPDDVALTLRALHQSRSDHEVVVARDGVEALDYLHGTGAFAGRDARLQPALMLLDLNLPRLSGLNVLRQMQADPELSQIRVVVLTSSQEDEDIVASYAHGACSYVRKPVGFHEFLATVRRLSEYWLTLNEPVPCGPSA